MSSDLAAVVMAGGLGTRMKSSVPKHLHPLLGRRVDGSVLVLDAAAPLVTLGVLEHLVAQHRAGAAAVTILTIEPEKPLPYGRIVRGDDGSVSEIVEERDADDEQRAIRELNSSIYVFDATALRDALGRLDARNAQGELYLTDTISHIVAAGGSAGAWRAADATETIGINNRVELADAAAVLRDRINEAHMVNGVTIVDPVTTWIDASVQLEPDVVVHPFTVLRGATTVAAGAELGPHVVAVDSVIGERVSVGPFCYLRPGTVLDPDAKAGTFVELKNSRIGARTKVPHLSYLGDAEVGEDTNIAAGNITVNFPHQPGLPKGRTTIGKNVRTGVQNAFVAPVEIGDDAWIAAGSVITEDVPAGALAIARARQVNKEGHVARNRDD